MADPLGIIRSEGARILVLGREDRSRPVPQYPGWTMDDLLAHTGSVLGRTNLVCRDRLDSRPTSPRPLEGEDIPAWFGERLDEMLATLSAADVSTPVWGFGDAPSVGSWVTRMLVEVGMHRWDAEQAFGVPSPLRDEVAAAGLDEFDSMWLPRLDVQSLLVVASDLGRQWTYGAGDPSATVEASASDLYLRLMSRPSAAVLPDDWADAVDSLEPPPR